MKMSAGCFRVTPGRVALSFLDLRYVALHGTVLSVADDPVLGVRIRRARERLHLTQQQLADLVGVSLRSVSNWEGGHHVPKNRLGALEDVLGQNFTRGDAPEPEPAVTAEDEWERLVLADPALPPEEARDIVLRARRLKAALYRPGRAQGAPEGPAEPRTAAG